MADAGSGEDGEDEERAVVRARREPRGRSVGARDDDDEGPRAVMVRVVLET